MSVPNTNTFSLQDVVDEVSPTVDSLSSCFTASIDSYFDATYKGSKNKLSNFRNYNYASVLNFYMYGVDYDQPAGGGFSKSEVVTVTGMNSTHGYTIDLDLTYTNVVDSLMQVYYKIGGGSWVLGLGVTAPHVFSSKYTISVPQVLYGQTLQVRMDMQGTISDYCSCSVQLSNVVLTLGTATVNQPLLPNWHCSNGTE